MSTLTDNRIKDPSASFPETLLLVPRADQPFRRGSGDDHWYQQHNRAVIEWHKEQVGATSSVRRSERGILSFMAGVEQLVGSWSIKGDYVAADAMGSVLSGFGSLLNFDLGRLDGGTLSSWAADIAERCGIEQ